MTKNRFWALLTIFLIAIIATGGVVAWARYSPSQPIEISLPSQPEFSHGQIYVGGAVNQPGFYPLKAGDSIEALIQAAGGTTSRADPNLLKLHVPESGETTLPQRIDINRAEAWLLEALPEIGEVKAQAIIAYRQQNGPFHITKDLTKVEGISTTIFEQIKDLITVAD
jgi:competence protein ComEA